jgi:hypothetical protein
MNASKAAAPSPTVAPEATLNHAREVSSDEQQAYQKEQQAYQKMVAQIAAAADGRVIVNRSESHAAVVIEHVFRSAEKEIDIITGRLHEPIYGNPAVIDAAVTFFESHPEGRMNILSEERVGEAHPMIAALHNVRDRIDLRVMSADLAKGTPFHFAVADARSFRFEPDKTKFEAYGQFGEPKTGERLRAVFNRLQSQTPAAA